MFRPSFENLERRDLFVAGPIANVPTISSAFGTRDGDETAALLGNAVTLANQDIEVENDETHWVGHDRARRLAGGVAPALDGNRGAAIDTGVDYTHPDLYVNAAPEVRAIVAFESQTRPHADGLLLEVWGYLDDTDIVQSLRARRVTSIQSALFGGHYSDGDFVGFTNTTFDDEAAAGARTESVGNDEKITIGGARTESVRLTEVDGDGLITFITVATGDVNHDGLRS
jgi:hypothetical protein